MPSTVPFFIVGSGRSGTTLLRLILGGHSRIQIPPETWFIWPLVQKFSLTNALSETEVSGVTTIMINHLRWRDMNFPPEDFLRQVKALEQPKLVDIINLVYRNHLEASGKQRFGDKTPNYINIISELGILYPGAQFIHLIRDGRDVAISRIDAGWERYHDHKSFPWTLAMKLRRSYLPLPISPQVLEVRYEDLVSDLEPTVRRICAFLNEDFEPEMLDWRKSTDQVPERERYLHRKLDQPISDDSVAVWQTKLSPLECFLVEACLHEDLLELGYKLRFSGISWRPALKLTGFLLRRLSPVLQRGVPYLQRRNYLPKTIYI